VPLFADSGIIGQKVYIEARIHLYTVGHDTNIMHKVHVKEILKDVEEHNDNMMKI